MMIDPVFYIFGVVDSRGMSLTDFYRDPDRQEIARALQDYTGSVMFRAKVRVDTGSVVGVVGGKLQGRPRQESRSALESIIRQGMDDTGIETYSRLAHMVGVSPAIIQQWCTGNYRPSGDIVKKLSQVLGVNVEEIQRTVDQTKPARQKSSKQVGVNKHHGRYGWLLDQATPEELAHMWDGQPVETADGDFEPWGLPALRARLAAQGVTEPAQTGIKAG